LAQPSFNFKTETFIQTDRCFVVCVDFELESRKVKPVVCEINERAHEFFAYAFALPVPMHGNPNCAGVFPAWPVWNSDTNHSADAVFNDPDEVVNAFSVFRQSFSPVFTRRIRELQRTGVNRRRSEHFIDRIAVVRFSATDS